MANKLYDSLTAANIRIQQLESAFKRIRDARLEWAMVCTCSCPECDRLFESIKIAEHSANRSEATTAPTISNSFEAETGTEP